MGILLLAWAGACGNRAVAADAAWAAETVQFRPVHPQAPNSLVLQHPVGLHFDAQGRAVVAWTGSESAGGNGTGWWAVREAGGWNVRNLSRTGGGTALFTQFANTAGAVLAASSNRAPFLVHVEAQFAFADPIFLVRVPLATAPEGPGAFLGLLPGAVGLHGSFDADGRASGIPDVVTHVDRSRIRLNFATDLTGDGLSLGDNNARLVFRQGPQRQVHVIYPTADGTLRYNGGGPDRDVAILRINTGSSPHSLAVDDANGLHVAAAQGTGRYFFGAVGRLAYLHSADGVRWTTNLFSNVPEEVGATAIALDGAGRPAIAFTRGFDTLYFTRLTGNGWTEPALIRTRLGGWDRSRGLNLAFGPKDVPHLAVADHAAGRLLVLRAEDTPAVGDLAVTARAETARAALGTPVTITVTVTNASPRNTEGTQLRVRFPPEIVVRAVQPLPTHVDGSLHTFDLGTVFGLESRSATFTVSSLDPVLAVPQLEVGSATPEARPGDNRSEPALTEFLPAGCLADPASPACSELVLLPASVAPAEAGQPWALRFRAPRAAPGSRLQVSPSTPLPPGFCLTADGELRGIHESGGFLPLTFDLVEPGGRITSFERDVGLGTAPLPAGLVGFWPLDGTAADMVRGVPAVLSARATYLPGVTGLGLQSAVDALNTGSARPDLSQPAPLLATAPLADGAPIGRGAVTVMGWFRRDGQASSRGDPRPAGFVFGLAESDLWTRERYLAFDPGTGRLDVLDGPPDFRANVVRGPALGAGAWHHLALVCEGTAVRVFTNGVLAAQGTFRAPLVDHPRLLAGGAAMGGEFSGALDELAVFQRALEPAEILAFQKAPPARRTPLPPGGEFPLAATLRELVLPEAPEGEPYQAALAPAFCGTPGAFRLVEGALPAGLALEPDGRIHGASETAGTVRFRVRAADAAGATADLEVQLTTRPGLPVFVRQPADQDVEAGDLLVLFAETRGPAELQWTFNGRPLDGQTESVLAIPECSAGQAGVYQLQARNAAGTSWSLEARVRLRTSPATPPPLAAAPVELRPDGLVRLRVETLRGRVYELQRATDLAGALGGGWRTLQRFLATGGVGEFIDVIPGRPDAAFYRVVEVVPPPAAAYSLEDPGRLIGLAEDGTLRPGLLPAQDPDTGRLGPFEYRPGGETVPLDQGLVLRLPQGAQPLSREGGTALRFQQAELFFGEESPVQLDEGGRQRIVLTAAEGMEVPSGPLSVEDLERLLGKPRGNGIGLTFFRHFHFRLLSGTFDGPRIRNAQLAWADRAAGTVPTPDRTGSYLDFDIELGARQLRLPFYGEFVLPDGSPTPGRFTVAKSAPIWVELRPGPEIAVGGRARAAFGGGPEFDVDLRFDPPVFHASLAAARFRLPENLSLRQFLPPLPSSLDTAGAGLAQAGGAPNASEAFPGLDARLRALARSHCSGSALARKLLGEKIDLPDYTRPPGLEVSDDELAARDFTEETLADLKAWTCFIEAAAGVDDVFPAIGSAIVPVLERHLDSALEEVSPILPRGAEIGPMTYAYRATVLGELATMALAGHPDTANPILQPYLDRAYQAFRGLSEADPSAWDTTTLIVAARSVGRALRVAATNPLLLAQDRAAFLRTSFEDLIRARGDAMRRELKVARGTYQPDGNPAVTELHRWEAMARIRQGLTLNALGELAGLSDATVDPVAPEVLGQLAHHAWRQIQRLIHESTNTCTPTGFHTVLALAPDLARLAKVSESLRGLGIEKSLPEPADVARIALEAEQHCAQAQPPQPIESLLQNDPANLTARAEAHLALLEGLPATLTTASPEITAGISAAGASLRAVLGPGAAPRLQLYHGSQLIRVLVVALRYDELRRRFQLAAEPDWLGIQLPRLTRLIREKGNRGEGPLLQVDVNELLLTAARRQSEPAKRSPGEPALHASAPEADRERTLAYFEAAREGVADLHDAVRSLGTHLDDPLSRAAAALADVRLPGGLTVEKAFGELTYHHGEHRLDGAFGGQLQIPGLGLRLDLARARFSSGGAFSGEVSGSLTIPPAQPLATLSIPADRPARLTWARGRKPALSGGGRLEFQNGARLDCFLGLEDPVYRFGAAASSLRFGFSRLALGDLGFPTGASLPDAATGTALEYLARVGLLLEGGQPEPPPTTGGARLRRPDPRPQPADEDDLAANAAALRLLLSANAFSGQPALDSPRPAEASAASGEPGPLSGDAVAQGVRLVRLFLDQAGRSTATLAADAANLKSLGGGTVDDARPVPPAELPALRGARRLEVARRLGVLGTQYADLLVELNTARGRQLVGAATNVVAFDAVRDAYLRGFRDCLVALRDALLDPVPQPLPGRPAWLPGAGWDVPAATNAWVAALRLEATVQAIQATDPTLSQAATDVGCSLLQALIDDRLVRLGLDPASGAVPTGGGPLAIHLALAPAEAADGLTELLQYEAWLQTSPACTAPSPARLTAGIAGAALRLRELVVDGLQDDLERQAAAPARAWDRPERLLAAATDLFPVVTLPQRLGIERYPARTFALLPRSTGETIDAPTRDATDVVQLLADAAGELAALLQDEGSGYPAELRRRRATPLPPAGPLARLLARHADLPGVAAFRTALDRLALFEAGLLDTQSTAPDLATRLGRDAARVVERALNAAQLLDRSPAPNPALASAAPGASAGAVGLLLDTVLPRLQAAVRANPDLPWWVGLEAARALHAGRQVAWSAAGAAASLRTQTLGHYETVRTRLAALAASHVDRTGPDFHLPGELEVRRVFGNLLVNRETRYVMFEIGGRLEFPGVRTVDGQGAFLELQQLRLESSGAFAFAAASRGPLPFAEASFAGAFAARGDLRTRALSLAGEGTLTLAAPPVNPDTGQPFPTTLSARATYEPVGFDAQGNPDGWKFTFQSGGTFRRSFGEDFALFGAGAGFVVGRSAAGNPIGGLGVGGSAGLFRKSARRGIEPPSPSDFHLVVENAGVEIVGTAGEGGHVALTNGVVRLPEFFYPADLPPELACDPAAAPRTGASVAVRTPIRLSYAAGGKPRLEGALRFSHFGIRLGARSEPAAAAAAAAPGPGAPDPYASLVVCQGDVGIDPDTGPYLDLASAGLSLNVPSWDRGVIRLQNVHLGFDGRIQGRLFLAEDFDLLKAGDLRATLLGAPAYADPNTRSPAGCQGTALVLEDVPGFPEPRLVLTGGLRVELPSSLITRVDGTRVGGYFCGGIRVDPTDRGPQATAFIDELGFSGEFAVGRSPFRLRNARIGAANFGGILAPDPERPFHLSISGDLQTGPFTFGLEDAQIRYRGLEIPPAFALDAVRYSRDATQTLPAPFSFLPAIVDFAELRFKDPAAPLEEALRPANLQITTSFRVGLPTVENAFLSGGASGVVFSFREDGTPIPPPIDGFDLAISPTANLKLPALGDLGGKVRIGGLRRALERNNPGHIYAAGQLTATSQGFKLGLLGAFNLVGPIGLCLDVNLGPAGFTVAPTPFQITGASGGIAFLTTDNPCDFGQYFELDPVTGYYQLRQTLELPNLPVGMPWQQFTDTLQRVAARAEAFARNFDPGSIPLPGPAAPALHTPPPGSTFGCPEGCPPRTVAILCQPHPDAARFPNRVIFKFSSIPEAQLTNAPPAGFGLDAASLRTLGSDSPAIARAVAARVVATLADASPLPTGLPAEVLAFLADQEQQALEAARTVLVVLLENALRQSPDAYAAVRDALYEGIPCPDLSLALAGRASLVGLSAFAWVEGRETSALSGSGGVVGELHVLGVPFGQARAFISTTDAQGLPNPSACGQVTAALGPLDLGRVDLALRCEGCVTELLRLFPTLAHALGEPFLRPVLERLAPELSAWAADPPALLARLRQRPEAEQVRLMLGVFQEAQAAGPGVLPGNLGPLLRDAVADTWSRINPQLVFCGDLTPRLFGLPLTVGGRAAALNFLGDKTGVAGEFAFSPGALVPLFPPGDEALLSFALRARDPYLALLQNFDGTLTRADTRNAFLREQAEYALQNLVVAAQYQWHPFGLELGDAALRVLLPDVFDHPALPGRNWRNPDDRAGEGWPTRDEVLVQAAASGKLGRAFDWIGGASDFADIFPPGDPRGDGIRARQLELRRDYFPHGGVVGGGRMALPRILMVAPGTWRPLHEQVVHGTNLLEQFSAAATLIEEFILRTETNGTAALYVPAPNPPGLYGADGRPLPAGAVAARMAAEPDAFSPDGLMRQIRALDLGAPQSAAHLYPDDLAFLRAEMTNLTLLGVPVFGAARLTGRPTPLRALDGQPLARLEVDVAGNSAVGKVAGGPFSFGFDLHASPAQGIAAWARQALADLERERRGGAAPSLASAGSALDRFQRQLALQLPRFATTNPLPSLVIGNPREWAGAGVRDLVPAGVNAGAGSGTGGTGFGSLFGSGLAAVAQVPIGPPAPPLLRADLALMAFSPLYDPATPGDGPVVEARRAGGLAATGRLEFLPETAGRTGSGEAEVAVTLAGNQPRLLGRIRNLNLPTPFAGVSLQNAAADFDNQSAVFLRARSVFPRLALGPLFQVEPAAPGQSLGATVALRQVTLAGQAVAARAELELAAARLSSPLLGGGALLLHGAGSVTNPVSVSESRWTARASFAPDGPALAADTGRELVLRADLAGARRDVVRLGGLPAAAFAFEAWALDQFQARLDAALPGELVVDLFPGQTVPGLSSARLRVQPPASGQLQLEFGSDGAFTFVGALASPFNAGVPGVFAAGAEVRIDATGATISGSIGSATGNLRVAAFDQRLEARFTGQLTLPALSLLGGRITLASPDGGDLVLTNDGGSNCVRGAVLTLRDFAPDTAPVRLAFPGFCLDALRGFSGVAPAGASPALHAGAPVDLRVGAFTLGDLHALRLSGNLEARTLRLDFDATLALRSLLSVPVRGTLGSDGLGFRQNTGTTRLLGFDLSGLRLGSTNRLGDLPDLAFAGRIPALPAPLSALELGGRIPGDGGFSLAPDSPADLAGLIPSFPIPEAVPHLDYQPEPPAVALRAAEPAGYWPLDEAAGAFLDQRLAAFKSGQARRSGDAVGGVTRSQTPAFTSPGNAAARFDGTSGYVRLASEALAPPAAGFTVSLWFRRNNNLALTTPRHLAARGGQWSLHLQQTPAGPGTRLNFALDGLQLPDGSPAGALAGRTRVDDLEWHHVAAVHDGAAQYLYLDGRLDAWRAVRGSVAPAAGLSTTLAARLDGATASGFFGGWLDEVALYRSALGPVDLLRHGLAAGRGGIRLSGRLGPEVLPGLPSPAFEGVIAPNGDAALRLVDGGTGEFAGLRLPSFRATLLRAAAAGNTALVFESDLALPGLDSGVLGTVRGTWDSSGAFQARAASFADRGVFGWNLRLTNLLATGNWVSRTLAFSAGGRLGLPHDLAHLDVGGELDPVRNRYTLRGTAGGVWNLSPQLPFSFDAAPEMGPDLFKISGRLALGPSADAARFQTGLEIGRTGEVLARFSGTTGWKGFPGVGYGQLRWSGRLAYVQGQPDVRFVGVLGLASPDHPDLLSDLPAGLKLNKSGKVLLSLRTPEAPITVNASGAATARAEPAFQGQSFFDFQIP